MLAGLKGGARGGDDSERRQGRCSVAQKAQAAVYIRITWPNFPLYFLSAYMALVSLHLCIIFFQGSCIVTCCF